jgi:hypothetical protein
VVTTNLSRFEGDYPGCSHEPPWWPTKEKIRYYVVSSDSRHGVGMIKSWPVDKDGKQTEIYGPNGGGRTKMMLCATYGKRDPKTLAIPFAYWDTLNQAWEIVTP